MGDFSEFIYSASVSGGNFSYHYIFNNKLALGFDAGINGYSQKKTRQTFVDTANGFAITASHYNYVNSIPVKFVISYYLSPEKIICPYFRIGLGTNYMVEHLIIQDFDTYKSNWGFLFSPEAGINARFGRFSRFGMNLAFSYWMNTNKFSFGYKEYSNLQGININLGISYLLF